MLFLRLLSTAESVSINLILDLVRSVRHEDAGICIRGTHFRLGTLEGGEELGVNQSGFRVFELRGDISSQTEVWVLVDRTRDETGYIRDRTEYLREGVGEGWRGLDGGKVDFTNVVARGMDKQISIRYKRWDPSTHESLKPKVALACEMVI